MADNHGAGDDMAQGHGMTQGNRTTGNVRRTFAAVAAVAVLAGGLGACGTDDEPSGVPVGRPDGTTAAGSGAAATRTPATHTSPPATATTTRTADAPASATPTPTAEPTQSTKPRPTSTSTSTSTPEATTTPSPKPPSTPEPREDLRYGDRGAEVLALQRRLSELGYWLGEADGHFGSLTQQAVWALQKSAGLSRDGRVGPRTERALDNGVRPSTRLSGNGIDIDLKRQILMVVRDGRVKYILNTSTGGGYTYERKDGSTGTARTPKGTFRVYYTVDGRDEGFLGEMWRPRYFHGGYAVHGSPSIPAYPASHGCARVSNSAMNMIWARDYMPKGSTVLVR